MIEWVVAGYGLTTAIGLVTAGRLGDRVGRRRVFWAGMLVFTLASAVCGLAPSGGALVAARLVQGLGAALVTPQVLSILSVVYEGKERARAFGIYGMTLGLAAVLGQLIGGLLIQADVLGLGWRACFLINIPIGVVALVLLPRVVPESRVEGAGRLDLAGMAPDHGRPRRDRAAPDRGARPGLAAVDVAEPRRVARAARHLRRPSGPAAQRAAASRCSTPRCSASAHSPPGC